jgi:mannose/cellobiose epimerase-like protein (N-acyl-D-glucosamine 2-epimerase family)
MHERHGAETPAYWEAFQKTWRFTRERFTDEEKGGIYLGIDEHGSVDMQKSANWFASYHATRALLLTSQRLRRLAKAIPGT